MGLSCVFAVTSRSKPHTDTLGCISCKRVTMFSVVLAALRGTCKRSRAFWSPLISFSHPSHPLCSFSHLPRRPSRISSLLNRFLCDVLREIKKSGQLPSVSTSCKTASSFKVRRKDRGATKMVELAPSGSLLALLYCLCGYRFGPHR